MIGRIRCVTASSIVVTAAAPPHTKVPDHDSCFDVSKWPAPCSKSALLNLPSTQQPQQPTSQLNPLNPKTKMLGTTEMILISLGASLALSLLCCLICGKGGGATCCVCCVPCPGGECCPA